MVAREFGRCFRTCVLVKPGYVAKKLLSVGLHHVATVGKPAAAWNQVRRSSFVFWWDALFANSVTVCSVIV
jgi:hypothetical protein